MSHEADALLPTEVEPFPLTTNIFHMCFELHTPTFPKIPTGVESQVRDAWIADVKAVTLHPHDIERWVRLLAFWICVLPTFQPACACDRRASTRALRERRHVERFLQTCHEPLGIFRLLTHVMERVPSHSHDHCRSSTQDPQVSRSRRFASIGRYRDAVAALSKSTPFPLTSPLPSLSCLTL